MPATYLISPPLPAIVNCVDTPSTHAHVTVLAAGPHYRLLFAPSLPTYLHATPNDDFERPGIHLSLSPVRGYATKIPRRYEFE